MKNLISLLLIVLFGSISTKVSAQEKRSPSKHTAEATAKSKRNKKAIENYTHTKPAVGTRATRPHVAKKYNVITGLMLKSSFEKYHRRSKPKELPVRS